MGDVAHDPDDLWTLAARRLPTRWAGHPLTLLTATGSTNDDARAAANAGGSHGLAIVADTQSAGRGRRGRAWHSPPGTSLYVSLLLRPRIRPADAPLLALAAGLAVRDAIASVIEPARITLKWPNDVRIDGRKVAGVLLEGSVRGDALAFAVLGVGINVNVAVLPDELRDTATSVRIARGAPARRDELLLALFDAVEHRVDALVENGTASTVGAFAAHCDTLGTRVRVDGVSGVAESITPSGGLLIQSDDGRATEVRAGDVLPEGL